MVRHTIELTEENVRRLEILCAFSMLKGDSQTVQSIVNAAIERIFKAAYAGYVDSGGNNLLMEVMRGLVPADEGRDDAAEDDEIAKRS